MDAGWAQVHALANISGLEKAIRRHEPDIVLIDMANPDRDTLEHISAVSDTKSRTVAMFVDQSDEELTQAAVNAGVSAYVVDGLHMNRIKPVLETAIMRFQMMRKMQSELDAGKASFGRPQDVGSRQGHPNAAAQYQRRRRLQDVA